MDIMSTIQKSSLKFGYFACIVFTKHFLKFVGKNGMLFMYTYTFVFQWKDIPVAANCNPQIERELGPPLAYDGQQIWQRDLPREILTRSENK